MVPRNDIPNPPAKCKVYNSNDKYALATRNLSIQSLREQTAIEFVQLSKHNPELLVVVYIKWVVCLFVYFSKLNGLNRGVFVLFLVIKRSKQIIQCYNKQILTRIYLHGVVIIMRHN